MRIQRFVNMLILLVLLASSGFTVMPVRAQGVVKSSYQSIMDWNAIAQSVIVPKQSPSHAVVSMAFVHAAIYDAVVAIEGRYQPYAVVLPRSPNASIDAAVAAAAHDVLVNYFQNDLAFLDGKYGEALAAVPDGPAKTAGIMLGQAAAAGLIQLRQGDGYQVDIGFQMPGFGPGVWQLMPGQQPLIPWLSQTRPFLMDSPNQFRPEGPPAMTSVQWAKDYNEVKEVGRVDSQTRTADQTDASRFFIAHPIPMYTEALNEIIKDQKYRAVDAARAYAMDYLIVADANIACYDAKYEFLFWRPQLAIQNGDIDGNPNTVKDAAWTPLIGTPPHPEYISGHGCFTASTAEVFAALLGTRNIDVDLTNNAANIVTKTRHYQTVHDLTEEIINVRIWSGIHYRTSDVHGVEVGTAVARWALKRYFQPLD